MDILESQLDSNIVDDMFIEVCKNLDFDNLLNLQLLSKYNKHLIRKTKWFHVDVKLNNTSNINDKVNYLATNFNFMKYILFLCDNITDESVKMLCNVHSLDLSCCYNITDESAKMLGNVHSLNLTRCYKITDESVKMLGNVHTLNLNNYNKITDESVKMLGNVHSLDLTFCNITDELVKMLGNIHSLKLYGCDKIKDETVKMLEDKGVVICR